MQLPKLWDSRFTSLLTAFTNNGVEYLLTGSMAKSYYSRQSERPSDMDLLINPTLENAGRVEAAFRDYGRQLRFDPKKLTCPKQYIRICDYGDHLADVLTPAASFSFSEARDRSIEIEIVDGITAQVAAECDLEMLDSLREQSERERSE